MHTKAPWLFLLFSLHAFSITPEVVKVYRPTRYVESVSFTEIGEEAYQAGVLPYPTVISGAIPEDLIASIQSPTRLNQIPGIYEVDEVNLLTLCGLSLGLTAESAERLEVTISLQEFALPEQVEMNARTILTLTKTAIRRTLTAYFQETESYLEVNVVLIDLKESQTSLSDLDESYSIGSPPEDEDVLEEEE